MQNEPSHKLTDKRKRFCEEYMVDLNATQAAIRAGYSESGARTEGARLLADANVQDYIQELQKGIMDRNQITIDECVQSLAKIMRCDILDFYNDDGTLKDLKDIPESSRAVIEEITNYEEKTKKGKVLGISKKLKTYNKLNAIEKLMRHLGGYEKDNGQKDANNIIIYNIPDNGRG